uniref:NADH-ubiquinone oxidoreductase chain 6 n=1 Tax=Selaginella moellendorffii TaxID=88036 RepID=F2YI95_SELML|nr:NADH dehydrogenase subunit 6 [Selaginella moellendorffii]AEA29865.1 NADH dehydrogenase subunit 6 [Selaginella moellendorffii]
MNNSTILFGVLSSLALVSGGLVVRSGALNPVPAVFLFLLVFVLCSGLLVWLDLDFFAMIFLVVYAGAMVVFFLFVVMMCTFRREGREHEVAPRHTEFVVGLLFLSHLWLVLERSPRPPTPSAYPIGEHCGHVTSATHLDTLGTLLYTHVPLLFIGSGLILLVALLGAIVLTVHTPGD